MAAKKDEKSHLSSFESTVSRLETIIDGMENQETGLQESLAAFEEGISLLNKAHAVLANAEQKVNVLIEKNAAQAEAGDDEAGASE